MRRPHASAAMRRPRVCRNAFAAMRRPQCVGRASAAMRPTLYRPLVVWIYEYKYIQAIQYSKRVLSFSYARSLSHTRAHSHTQDHTLLHRLCNDPPAGKTNSQVIQDLVHRIRMANSAGTPSRRAEAIVARAATPAVWATPEPLLNAHLSSIGSFACAACAFRLL